MEQEKQVSYSIKDSSHVFLYAILIPQLIGIFAGIIALIVASYIDMDYEQLVNDMAFTYMSLFIAQFGFLLVYFGYNKLKNINFVKASKLNIKVNYKQIIIGILIAVASLIAFSPIINLVDYLISLTGYSVSGNFPIDLTSTSGFIVAIVSLAILPSISEELIFRGVVYNGLQKLGKKKAIVLSAIIFALMHLSIQQTFYQIIIGLILAYAVYITGGLIVSIVMHFTNNFIIIVMGYIAMKAGEITEVVYNYNSFFDYALPVIYAALGVALILSLFKLLKYVSPIPKEVEEINLSLKDSGQEDLVDFEDINKKQKEMSTLRSAFLIASILWLLSFAAGL